jgi:hypothetical protein
MTRLSDPSNEWVICLFDFTGRIVVSVARRTLRQRYGRISTYQNKLGATNSGESHGSRRTVHHWHWVPTLAANSNRHRNRAAIGMLNLFLGWTFIGWVVALLWADTDNCET